MSQSSEASAAEDQEGGLPENGQEALSVLKTLWQAQGQGSHTVEQSCESNTTGSSGSNAGCKNTKHMGFEGLIDEVEATNDTDEAIDNVQTAWRKKLEREGKLHQEGKSVRDMVLGDAQGNQ